MKKLILFYVLFNGALTFGLDEAKKDLIRSFEYDFKLSMQEQNSKTQLKAEKCIKKYISDLRNFGILPANELRAKELKLLTSYQEALDRCRACQKMTITGEAYRDCYGKTVGYTGLGLLEQAGLSAKQVIQQCENIEQEEQLKKNITQEFECKLLECYQRAGGNKEQLEDCYEIYKDLLQVNGLPVPSEGKPEQNNQQQTMLAWLFSGWWR